MIQTEQEKYPDENASIPFFVVIGDMQADQQTGIETPTLHPCGVCRNTFLENDTPINLDSICVTARPDLKEIEWYTVRSLIDYHNGLSDGSDFGYASYDSRPLALSIPMPGRSNIPIILSDYDTPEMLESDHQFVFGMDIDDITALHWFYIRSHEKSETAQALRIIKKRQCGRADTKITV
jgi:hypothetical protein